MKFFLIITLSFIFYAGKCQLSAENLSDDAYQLQQRGLFDSAIHLLQTVRQKYPSFQPSYTLFRLRDCYEKKGNNKYGMSCFIAATRIDMKVDDERAGQNFAAGRLANIYKNRKEYAKALTYYDVQHTKFKMKKAFGCGNAKRGQTYRLAQNKAECFKGLKMYDSVAYMLTPYMFHDYEYAYINDTAEYDSLSRVFADAIVHVLGTENAKDLLKKAVNNFHYDTVTNALGKGIVINSYVEFFGKSYFLHYFDIANDDKQLMEYVSKANILNEIMHSPAYRFIMYDECEIEYQSHTYQPLL